MYIVDWEDIPLSFLSVFSPVSKVDPKWLHCSVTLSSRLSPSSWFIISSIPSTTPQLTYLIHPTILWDNQNTPSSLYRPLYFLPTQCVTSQRSTTSLPPFPKLEIETQITKMPQSGWVQPCNNPLSSFVLLLKKKDDNWRICINYRALNALNIHDCFSLSTIKELLESWDIPGSSPKLDLTSGFYQIHSSPKT